MYRFNLKGYAHLYRSLMRFVGLEANEAKRMLYLLNTANLDSCRYRHPERFIIESDPSVFVDYMKKKVRPYHTEIQLYKSLYCLCRNIDMRCIIDEQRDAVMQIKCIMGNLEYRFRNCFGMDIDDKQTVYAECAYSLIPDEEDEPSCCFLIEWLMGF